MDLLDLGLGPGPLGAIDNTPISISNIVPMGIFQDVYSFTLVDPGTLSGNAIAINVDRLHRLWTVE